MTQQRDFNFGDSSVAANYDRVIVPSLFVPWADSLVDGFGDWRGQRVLDLATGTGVVAERLAARVGPEGKVIGSDINEEMLEMARRRCAGNGHEVEFVQSPAHPLELGASSIDVVVCQQGFQFFPDREAAAAEIHRVLAPGGSVILTTWCPVAECQYFGWICEALEALDEPGISETMKVPFDFMPGDELGDHFVSAGFEDVQVGREEKRFTIAGDAEAAVELAYASPIASLLAELPADKQDRFRQDIRRRVVGNCSGGTYLGKMVSHVLTATKGD